MKFKSVKELLEFVNTAELDITEYEVLLQKKQITETCEGSCSIQSDIRVELDFPSGKKEYKALIGEENILFVESYEAIPNFCGSGSFIFDGKKISCNICEYENKTKVSLDLFVNGELKTKEFYLSYIQERKDENLIILKDDN